jgi:hypothetical protein
LALWERYTPAQMDDDFIGAYGTEKKTLGMFAAWKRTLLIVEHGVGIGKYIA